MIYSMMTLLALLLVSCAMLLTISTLVWLTFYLITGESIDD